ncbi:MAG: hypothetical protein ACPGUD_12005 [Parashewanella sp.]
MRSSFIKSLSIFALLLLTKIAYATPNDGLCPGNQKFTTQNQITTYFKTYPNCTIISGDVVITTDEITDLSPFKRIKTILGTLRVWKNNTITSFEGFDNLQQAEALDISATAIKNFVGFNQLQRLVGKSKTINFSYNSSLTTINGFNNLQSAADILFENNNDLTSISGFDKLTSVDCVIDIDDNNKLQSIAGFTSLKNINNQCVYDSDYPIPRWFKGVYILANPELSNISGFDSLQTTSGLTFDSSDKLASISATSFLQVQQVNGNFEMTHNAIFNNLDNFSNIKKVTGDFYVSYAPNITSFSSFKNLQEIDGALKLYGMSAIKDFSGLSNLSVLGAIDVQYLNSLTNVTGLENIKQIPKGFELSHNDNLADISALKGLSAIGGSINITADPLLNSLSSFDNLTTQLPYELPDRSKVLTLQISDNKALTSITALSHFNAKFDALKIDNNFSLPSLKGIEKIQLSSSSTTSSSSVTQNYNLSDCSALCSVMSNGGQVDISNFSGNCQSNDSLQCSK